MKENNKSFVVVVVIIAVLVVGYIIGISYANKKAREVVDMNIERVQERLAAKGTEATITYENVKVHGMTLTPRASIYGLHVKLDDKARRRENHIAMPEVVFIPHNFAMSHYTFKAIDGVSLTNTARGASEGVLLDFSQPPSVTVHEKGGKGREYSMYVPLNVTMTDTSETGEATADKTDVTFASEPKVSWTEDASYNTLDQQAVFPRTVISQNGAEAASFDGFNASTKHDTLEDGRINYDTLVKLDNLVFADADLKVLNPVSLVNEVAYTGVVPTAGQTAPADVDISVKNIAVMSGLVSLFANGELHFSPTDKMPSGKLMVRFDDIDTFLKYVSEQRPNTAAYMLKVREALEKLSGAAIEEGGNVTINLLREANGRLEVGELTLEEALGLFIELAMEVPDFSAPEADVAEDAVDETTDATTDAADVQEEMVNEAEAEEAEEEMVEEAAEAADAVEAAEEEAVAPAAATTETPAKDDAVTTSPTKPASDVEVEIRTNADEVNVEVMETEGAATEEAPATPAAQEAVTPEVAPAE